MTTRHPQQSRSLLNSEYVCQRFVCAYTPTTWLYPTDETTHQFEPSTHHHKVKIEIGAETTRQGERIDIGTH